MLRSIVKFAPILVASAIVFIAAACGSSGGGSGNCGSLSTCCGHVPAADTASCNSIVTANIDADCAAALSSFESAKECGGAGGSTATGSSSTGTASTSSGSSGNCSSLSTCCGKLPAADTASCDSIVTAGIDADCAAALSAFQAGGEC